MKTAINVKKYSEISDRDYEECLTALFRQAGDGSLGLNVERASNTDFGRIDFQVMLRLPQLGQSIRFLVETNSMPRPSQFNFADPRKRDLDAGSKELVIPVLAAPFISKRIAELCEKHGWSWFDLSGNCRIRVPGAIFIERTGFKPIYKQPRPLANLSTAASARVLRALLTPQNAGRVWTQTELKKHCEEHDCGFSFGLVSKVIGHLRDQALIREEDDGFTVSDPIALIEAWGKAYRFDRHRRLTYFTLLKKQELESKLAPLGSLTGKAAYSVFTAAELDAPNVRQNKTWLYVNAAALDDFEQMAQAKQVDSGANIVVLVPEDDGVFYGNTFKLGGSLGRTNPVQTWLDLMHVGGRGEEAAEAILSQCLKPKWKGVSNV
jgi:hypothetical protein